MYTEQNKNISQVLVSCISYQKMLFNSKTTALPFIFLIWYWLLWNPFPSTASITQIILQIWTFINLNHFLWENSCLLGCPISGLATRKQGGKERSSIRWDSDAFQESHFILNPVWDREHCHLVFILQNAIEISKTLFFFFF